MGLGSPKLDSRNFSTSYTYPLTLDEKLKTGDFYRKARELLTTRLKLIEDTSKLGLHSGPHRPCASCQSRNKQVKDAFLEYYESEEPGSLYAGNEQYIRELGDLCEGLDWESSSSSLRISALQDHNDDFLRDHLQLEFCTPSDEDSAEQLEFKRQLKRMFLKSTNGSSTDISEIIEAYAIYQMKQCRDTDAYNFQYRLQETRTAEERARLFTTYYCEIEPQDSATVKTLKAKYARQFNELLPHDIVLGAMKEEANRIYEHELGSLRSKANELQMAKSASMKEKRRRAEQADQRLLAKNEERSRYASCALRNCPNDIDLYEDPIECVICDWLASKDETRSRVYYCSLAHADEDFVSRSSVSFAWTLLMWFRRSTIGCITSAAWAHIVILVCLAVHQEKEKAGCVQIVRNMVSPVISARLNASSSIWFVVILQLVGSID
jgi:hypothetical protein